ncbi:TATA-box-binding protein [Cyclospora cayetanensis]|uniref:TATA-box-binding protein n=1 Tax=Cyclospora cayetanensis TaxID=88456 RepID=A0A6P6RT89_9EIME|nr:TATA-box-binding protein [Cyclospora cayetanensis]
MALLLPNACSVAPPSGAEEVSDQRLSGSKGHTEAPACEGEGTSASRASSPPLPAAGKLLPLGAADVLAAAASAENSAAAVAAEAPPVRVQNVIASGRVSVEGRRSACLDLRRIAVSCRLAEYNPRKVNACIIRLRKPKCTGLIFRSGRVMVTGAQSEDAALRAARLLVKMLQAVLGAPKIQLTEFAIENIVATADCGLPVRLEGLAFDHKEFCSYEPELFAGLVYRYNPTPSLKAVLLIFVSGKVVITGCKTAAEIQEVFHSFFPVLLKYHT